MERIQLRFILSCFTVFCLAWGLTPLAWAQGAGQTITIDADVSHPVYGNGQKPYGASPDPPDDFLNSDNNEVTVNANVNGGSVFGGFDSTNGSAMGNEVTINSGTVGGSVYGGYASTSSGSASATENIVTINGGMVDESVYGGYAYSGGSGLATASGNRVTISGGTVTGNVFGGQVINSNGSASATHNTVTISGSPVFDPISRLFGGDIDGSGDAFTGNTLNLHSPITVSEVQNFQNLNFYLPTTLAAGGKMLTIGNGGSANITGSTVNVGIDGASSPLAVNDQLILIDASQGTLTGAPVNTTANGQGMQGVTLKYEFDIKAVVDEFDVGQLTATVTKAGANERIKALSEGFLAGLILVNQGADLIAGPGMAQAAAAAAESGFGAFGAMAGGRSRYDTGSHVDMSSAALLTGLAWSTDAAPGRLTLGAFFEYGDGGYDTYNSFPTAASVRGDGDADRFGGGVLGRLDFSPAGPGRAYAEASGRAGRVYNEFHSDDLRDFAGRPTAFDSSSAYYGLHLGAGYLWNINEKTSLDLYGKYFWSGVEGDAVTLSSGESVQFEDSESQRLRLGGRLSYDLAEDISPYIGAAYEREFDGELRAATGGFSIDAPSLRGDTGIGEIGVTLKPSPDRPLSFDLGLTGYVGRREGVMGTFTMKVEF